MSGCYWVSRECVWQRLMLNRALTLKIKARLPRRDFDIMINQFKMTSLPLLILLPPNPQPSSHNSAPWPSPRQPSFVSREPGRAVLGNRTFVLSSARLCWDCDKTGHHPGFVWWHLGAGSDGPLYRACMLGLDWGRRWCLVLSRMMQMSPGVLPCPCLCHWQAHISS